MGSLKAGLYLEDLGLDGRIFLEFISYMYRIGVERIYLVQDDNMWLDVVVTVMNLRLS
jgi:hypothetical protein